MKISITHQDEALFVLNTLPQLEILNGNLTKEENSPIDLEERDVQSFSLNNEIDNFKNIFSNLNEILNVKHIDTKEFTEDFQNLLNQEIEKIDGCIENSVPNFLYATNILISKYSVFSFFSDVALKMVQDENLKQILLYLNNYKGETIVNMSDLMFKINDKIKEHSEGRRINNQIESQTIMSKDNSQLKSPNYIESKSKEYENMIQKLNNELKLKEFENNQLKENLEFTMAKLKRTESENKVITEKILKQSKDLIKQPNVVEESSQSKQILEKGNSVIVSQTGVKILTRKMLIDIIEEIYNSKTLYDKKCTDNRMPKETMEQHMYTYLNYKYGLKNLIIEWAVSIINAIKTFSLEDSEIFLFGKILKNEIEEEFRFTFEKLRNTVYELLIVYYL